MNHPKRVTKSNVRRDPSIYHLLYGRCWSPDRPSHGPGHQHLSFARAKTFSRQNFTASSHKYLYSNGLESTIANNPSRPLWLRRSPFPCLYLVHETMNAFAFEPAPLPVLCHHGHVFHQRYSHFCHHHSRRPWDNRHSHSGNHC